MLMQNVLNRSRKKITISFEQQILRKRKKTLFVQKSVK